MLLIALLAGIGFILSIFLGIVSILAYKFDKKYRFLLSAIVFIVFAVKFSSFLILDFQKYIMTYFILDVIILILIYFSLVKRARSGHEN